MSFIKRTTDPIMEIMVDGVVRQRSYYYEVSNGMAIVVPNLSEHERICRHTDGSLEIITVSEPESKINSGLDRWLKTV